MLHIRTHNMPTKQTAIGMDVARKVRYRVYQYFEKILFAHYSGQCDAEFKDHAHGAKCFHEGTEKFPYRYCEAVHGRLTSEETDDIDKDMVLTPADDRVLAGVEFWAPPPAKLCAFDDTTPDEPPPSMANKQVDEDAEPLSDADEDSDDDQVVVHHYGEDFVMVASAADGENDEHDDDAGSDDDGEDGEDAVQEEEEDDDEVDDEEEAPKSTAAGAAAAASSSKRLCGMPHPSATSNRLGVLDLKNSTGKAKYDRLVVLFRNYLHPLLPNLLDPCSTPLVENLHRQRLAFTGGKYRAIGVHTWCTATAQVVLRNHFEGPRYQRALAAFLGIKPLSFTEHHISSEQLAWDKQTAQNHDPDIQERRASLFQVNRQESQRRQAEAKILFPQDLYTGAHEKDTTARKKASKAKNGVPTTRSINAAWFTAAIGGAKGSVTCACSPSVVRRAGKRAAHLLDVDHLAFASADPGRVGGGAYATDLLRRVTAAAIVPVPAAP